MKDELYYKKVYIKSEADLPKEKNWYYIFQSSRGMDVLFYTGDSENKINWLTKIDWYLQPIEQSEQVTVSDEEIKKHFYKTASFIYEGTQKIEFLTLKQVLKFAKWLRSKIEKK